MAVTSNKITYEDFTGKVTDEIENIINKWLYDCGTELSSEAATRTRRGTGETASKWDYVIDFDEYKCIVGNPLENAIWEEFGTGEYALNDDGRKGGWVYFDENKGRYIHTYGKTPNRALHHTFNSLEEPLKNKIKDDLRSMR